MRLSKYINLDKKHRKSLINTDVKNLGIGCVGMFLFSSFLLNWSFHSMDHTAIFSIYLVCFTIAEAFYVFPLILVYEGGYISIFHKYKNIPIDKRLFFRSKFILLTRFSLCFCIPVQLFHWWGLSRTETPYLSIVGFWPVITMALTLLAQYIYIRILARNFIE